MSKLIIITFMTVLILGLMNSIQALAASGSAKISGGGTYDIGDTVKIKVSVNTDETLYGVDLGVSYNPEVLKYESGADTNSSGIARIARPASSSSFSYTITFKAIASGSSSVKVIDAIGASTTEFKLSGGSTKVTVKAPVTYSSDNNLKSLQVSPGKLSPSFSSGTRKYSMTVDNDVKKMSVSATPKDDGAKVTSVSGNSNLKVGENKISVVVTAEDGSKRTYTITVTRKAATKQNNTTPTTKPSSEEKPTSKPEKPTDKPIENSVEEPTKQPVDTPIVPAEEPVEEPVAEIIELEIQASNYVVLTPEAI